jgi:hypothetical protein
MPAGAAAPWEAAGNRLAWGRVAWRVWGAGARTRREREPVGARRTAPGACILSDTGCIQAGLTEAEGVAQAVDIGALQPQGPGRHRMIALGLGQRLTQQLALEGYRGGMIQQVWGAGEARSGGAPTRDGGRSWGFLPMI